MSSESGNMFPLGEPHFFVGELPEICKQTKFPKYYFIRIKTRFKIRSGYLPFIQIKNTFKYKGNECLETSDVKINGEYHTHYIDVDGTLNDGRLTLTMTMTDYKLFREHYTVSDFEILDGCWFSTQVGIFDQYINHYKKIKQESTGALRELAKLFLNNLYGKMASSTDSSFKFAFIKDDNSIGFYPVLEHEKKPGYIPVGSAITSYARNFTIRAAQKNYHGVDKPGFIYADTDSIHCDLPPDKIVGIKVHDVNFCCWKLESCWDEAIFARQKTYIEHTIAEDLEPVEKPYYLVKCAGMPKHCKDLFVYSMEQDITEKEFNKLTDAGKEFVKEKRTIEDFCLGLTVPEKLMPKRIDGGVLLVSTTYKMR